MSESKPSCPAGYCLIKAISSGFLATVIMTVAMSLMGIDTMKSLGALFLGSSANKVLIYLVGGFIHFGVGVFYGAVYSKIDVFMKVMHPVLRGALYGIVLTVIAYVGMPVLIQIGNAVSGSQTVPHNPCAGGLNIEALLMSLGNHMVYGIVLALMYCRGCQKE